MPETPTPFNCYLISKEDAAVLGVLGNINSPMERYHLCNRISVNMRRTNCIGRDDTREPHEPLKKVEDNFTNFCFNPHRHTFT